MPFSAGTLDTRGAYYSVRIGFFGVRVIAGMWEFRSVRLFRVFFLRMTMISSINSCMHHVEGEF